MIGIGITSSWEQRTRAKFTWFAYVLSVFSCSKTIPANQTNADGVKTVVWKPGKLVCVWRYGAEQNASHQHHTTPNQDLGPSYKHARPNNERKAN